MICTTCGEFESQRNAFFLIILELHSLPLRGQKTIILGNSNDTLSKCICVFVQCICKTVTLISPLRTARTIFWRPTALRICVGYIFFRGNERVIRGGPLQLKNTRYCRILAALRHFLRSTCHSHTRSSLLYAGILPTLQSHTR